MSQILRSLYTSTYWTVLGHQLLAREVGVGKASSRK